MITCIFFKVPVTERLPVDYLGSKKTFFKYLIVMNFEPRKKFFPKYLTFGNHYLVSRQKKLLVYKLFFRYFYIL